MPKSLDEPLGVVAHDELPDEPTRLGQTLEAMEIEALLLQRAHEPFDDAVALRLADVRGRDRHPQPLHLVDPRIGDVLRAPVASDPQATGSGELGLSVVSASAADEGESSQAAVRKTLV